MRTFITRRRIETAETDGALNIQLYPGFGTPKAAIVYAMTNNSAVNANSSTLTSPSMSIGFMASVNGATGFTTRCSGFQANRVDAAPTERFFFTDGTCAHDTNNAQTVTRKWLASGFGNDIIFGSLVETGVQTDPLDLLIIAFAGDGVSAAVGSITLSNTVDTTAAITNLGFAPDAVFLTYQPSVTNYSTNANLCFGAGSKAWSGFGVSGQGSKTFEFLSGQDPSSLRGVVSNTRIARSTPSAALSFQLTGFSGVGFTITTRGAAAGNNTTYWLAIKSKSPRSFYVSGFQTYGASVGNTTLPLPFASQLVLGQLSGMTAFDTASTVDAGATCNLFAGVGHSSKNHTGVGTITSSTANATITGTGTSFRQQISIGDTLYNSAFARIGTVSAIGSETSITLAANAAVTQSPSGAYYYDKTLQYNFNYYVDDDNGAVENALRTRIGDQLLFNATAATPTTLVSGQMQNILNRNLLPYVLTTSAGRNGWIMAIADDEHGNEYRRGIEDIN